jgi:hypothetical protein
LLDVDQRHQNASCKDPAQVRHVSRHSWDQLGEFRHSIVEALGANYLWLRQRDNKLLQLIEICFLEFKYFFKEEC